MLPEQNFFAFLAVRPDLVPLLKGRIPEEIFSQEGRKIWNEGTFVPSTEPVSESDALKFLRLQTLSLLGREAGQAQKTLDLSGVRWALELVEQSFDHLAPPPIFEFGTITPTTRSVIPTGVEAIDNQIQGIAPGDLGIVAMPTGRGKTELLINFAVSALLQGHNVLYITVADQGANELIPRFDSCILETAPGPSADEIALQRRHKEAVGLLKGRLLVADYTDRECSLGQIQQSVLNNKADLIIVDHADDVLSPLAGDLAATRHSLRAIYAELKKIASRANVGLWTASQTHEWSWNMSSGSTNELAEAKLGKSCGAALVLVFTGGDNPQPGTMACTIAKARRAYSQRTFRINVDHAICRIW